MEGHYGEDKASDTEGHHGEDKASAWKAIMAKIMKVIGRPSRRK